jgi:hypothetical protein
MSKPINVKEINCMLCVHQQCHILDHEHGRAYYGGGPRAIWHVCKVHSQKVTEYHICESFEKGESKYDDIVEG